MMHEWASLPDTLVRDLHGVRIAQEVDAQQVGKDGKHDAGRGMKIRGFRE
jgi:hypothetical protein